MSCSVQLRESRESLTDMLLYRSRKNFDETDLRIVMLQANAFEDDGVTRKRGKGLTCHPRLSSPRLTSLCYS